MKLWSPPKKCSQEFLVEHHDLILYNIFHHVKVFLLFPPNCSCEAPCQCAEWRKKAILALNTNLYNRACRTAGKSSLLKAMKDLWLMPEDHRFRGLYADGYPVWAVEKELKEQEKDDHFKIIDQLVWTFLRLGKTTIAYLGSQKVSVNEAFKVLKKPPKNTKKEDLKENERRCGKKKYEDLFKQYKSVCHFIAAQAIWKKEVPDWEKLFSVVYPPLDQIERFLSLAHWFRKKLLSLKRRNVKENVFLLEKDLCPLPPWVQSEGIDFPVEPFEEKIQEVMATAIRVDPREQFLLRQARKANS